MFSCKQGQTSGSNIAKGKCSGRIVFVIITKIITELIVSWNYFVIISARMVVFLLFIVSEGFRWLVWQTALVLRMPGLEMWWQPHSALDALAIHNNL